MAVSSAFPNQRENDLEKLADRLVSVRVHTGTTLEWCVPFYRAEVLALLKKIRPSVEERKNIRQLVKKYTEECHKDSTLI